MKKAFFYKTKIGKIGIAENGNAITNIFFGNTVVPKEFKEEETPLLKEGIKQLEEYFEGKRIEFDIPLETEGTEFERTVWNALLKIPYGQTRTYKQIAEQIDRPKASRAVGRANGLNPISIFIPCHRVIGSNGKLTGYAGGLELKKRLLNIENIDVK